MQIFPGLTKYLRSNTPSNPAMVRAKLRDISDWYAAGTVPPSWDADDALPLWINPQSISWAIESQWSTANGHLSTDANVQWGYRSRQPITIPDMLVWTDDRNTDVTKYLDGLEQLTKPGDNSYPPILALVWGSRVIQPIVLTNMDVTEKSWASGLCSSAVVSLTFLYTKAPRYRSTADTRRLAELSKREQAKVTKDASDKLGLVKDATGKLRGNRVSNVPNDQQGKQITVNAKGEVLQGTQIVARYTKQGANGSFNPASFERVTTAAKVRR